MNPDTLDRLNRANEALLKAIEAQQKELTDQSASNPLGLGITLSVGSIIVGLCIVAVFIVGGAWVASQKGRRKWEGALLAFFFGPVGLIVEALLPSGPERKYRRVGRAITQPEYQPPDSKQVEGNPIQDEVMDWLDRN